jgi:predicted small integral membrane protein
MLLVFWGFILLALATFMALLNFESLVDYDSTYQCVKVCNSLTTCVESIAAVYPAGALTRKYHLLSGNWLAVLCFEHERIG